VVPCAQRRLAEPTSPVVGKARRALDLDYPPVKPDVPMWVPFLVSVYLKASLDDSYVEREQAIRRPRKKLNFIANLEHNLLRNHLQIKCHGKRGVVFEMPDNRVVFRIQAHDGKVNSLD
jgi:hypothetical protein